MKTALPLAGMCRNWIAITVVAGIVMCSGCASLRAPRPKPVTVPEVVQMTQAGTSAEEIILKMRASGTVYRLKASQLTDLQKQGVAAEVVDYMQQTYLEAVKQDAAYDEWRQWTMYNGYWYGGAPYGWPCERIYIIRRQDQRFQPHPPHK